MNKILILLVMIVSHSFSKGGDRFALIVGANNAADSIDGVQFGLFNFSNHFDGFAFGLFTYAGNGIFKYKATTDETGLLKQSLVSGPPYLYNELSVGTYPMGSSERLGFGYGLGSRIFTSQYLDLHLGVNVLATRSRTRN